ncbi:MAG: D-sedoheptulose 7-phosphate isomerase [Lachnospiraceae bacterium]|nr:D-sedoheptulose 7-phosphate isomerase [Lachnospiraceae bacterium]MDE7030316.1 D-sedoheptulose 7-phosphate isomerase [Lachnospiraceae bacterium]
MLEYIRQNIEESVAVKEKLLRDEALIGVLAKVSRLCIDAYQSGSKILICGNGGSASDALHMAGELVGRYQMERRGVAAIALNANAAVMTAISNDYDYENIFSRQVAALGRAGDVLFGISTSGNSANVEKALQEAKKRGIHTVGLTGRRGGKLQAHTEYLLNVPSDSTPRIQEMHILLIHTLCGLIENGLCEQGFWTEERD